jgi:TonB family protein
MTAKLGVGDMAFKRAMTLSAIFHACLLAVIVLNPSLPKPQRKGLMVFLPTNMIGSGGSGGSGGGSASLSKTEEKLGTTEVKRETLRDLAPVANFKTEPKPQLRYPTDKPKKEPAKKAPDKKTVIGKPDPSLKQVENKETTAGAPGQATGSGSRGAGLTIGGGGPGFGEGIGGDLAGQIGMSEFPYTYYLMWVRDKISSNWFTSLVDPGVIGTYQVAVYFRIRRDGSISNLTIRQSSGITSLDRSAERAILSSAPFAPLPPDYREDYLGIILIFEHSK